MSHIRMQAPRGHLSVTLGDGVTYQIDPATGEFEAHEAHKAALVVHGYHQITQRAKVELTEDEVAEVKEAVKEVKRSRKVKDKPEAVPTMMTEDELLAALKDSLPPGSEEAF